MLLIVLYDGIMLVQMTLLLVLHMSGVINNVLSDGNHTNGNTTTTSSSSLSDDAAAVTIASPLVWDVCST